MKDNKDLVTEEYVDTALLAGQLSLENGGETSRCENIMEHMLGASGSDEYFADVLSTTAIASLNGMTKLVRTSRWDTNLNIVCIANSVSRDLCSSKINIKRARSLLMASVRYKPYPMWMRLCASMLVGALLPLFAGNNPLNCVAAIVNGLILGLADEIFAHMRVRYFIVNIFQTLLMVLMTDLFAVLSGGLINSDIVLAASISPMLPGIALTNGVRDILSGDYLSGAGRMMEALVKALSIALGAGVGLIIGRLYSTPKAGVPVALEGTLFLVIQIIAAYAIAIGYAIRMVNPVRSIWAAALVGAMGRMTYTFLMEYAGVSASISTFAAAMLVALSGNLLARWLKTPTIVYIIAGIMCLVPGSALYRSVNGFVSGNMDIFRSELVSTLMISGAIAVAIFLIDTGFNIYTMARKKTLFYK